MVDDRFTTLAETQIEQPEGGMQKRGLPEGGGCSGAGEEEGCRGGGVGTGKEGGLQGRGLCVSSK